MTKQPNLEEIQKILIVMMGGVGNTVLLIPGLRALRKALPGRQIVFLTGEPGVEHILDNEHLIDRVILHDRRVGQGPVKVMRLIQKVRREKFDAAIVVSGTNAYKGSLLTTLMGIPYRIGENVDGKGYFYTTKVDYSPPVHEMEGMNKLVNALGVNVENDLPQLCLQPEEKSNALKYLSECGVTKDDFVVGIHTGSGPRQTFKRWPKERFAQVAQHLIDQHNAKIVLTGGPGEVELVDEVEKLIDGPVVKTAGMFPIRESAALVERCNLFVSNDSGIAHVAAAVNTPLVVLFGQTEFRRIAPRGQQVYMIRKSDEVLKQGVEENLINCIEVKDVLEAVNPIVAQVKSQQEVESEALIKANAELRRESRPQCPICQSKKVRILIDHSEHPMWRCRSCRLFYEYPIHRKRYITQVKEHYSTNDPFKRVAHARKGLYTSFLKRIERTHPDKGTMLDIGCGPGYFLALASKEGWDVTGIDINPDVIKWAKEHFGLNVMEADIKTSNLPKGHFDVITFWNVIDEVIDPVTCLKQAQQWLKPDGVIYMRVTNARFHLTAYRIFALLKTLKLGFLVPRDVMIFHIYNFNDYSVKRFCREHGLKKVRVYNSHPTEGDPYKKKAGRGLAKKCMYYISQGIYYLTLKTIRLAPSIEVYASNGKN